MPRRAPFAEGFNGRVAAITGAGSGIGRGLAIELARGGARLALCDLNEEGLEETRAAVSRHGAEATSARVDVADREAVEAWARTVEAEHGACHLVFNNAGVALAASLRNVSYEDFEWLMSINFWGVIHGTRAFLPILERQDAGHITNISSAFGLIAAPLNGTYNAAKFAVRGYTEALRMELELDGFNIGVTCVHPGGIRTNIAHASRYEADDIAGDWSSVVDDFNRVARTSPERCAQIILGAVKRNAPRVLVGPDAKLIDAVQRLAPTGYQRLLRGFAGRHWPKR